MWNLVSAKPIMDRRIKLKARMKHLEALNNIKGQIDNKSPLKPRFLSVRQKSKQLEAQKKQDIHHSNDILIGKMIKAETSVPGYKTGDKFKSSSLSKSYRRRVQRQIDIGNQIIIRKLQEIESCYPVQKILNQTDNYMYYRNNILNTRANSFKIYPSDDNLYREAAGMPLRPRSAKR